MATGMVQQLLTSVAWAPVDGPATSEVSGVSIGVEVASGGSGAPPRNRDALKSASESQPRSAIPAKRSEKDGRDGNDDTGRQRDGNSSAKKRTGAVNGSWTARQGPSTQKVHSQHCALRNGTFTATLNKETQKGMIRQILQNFLNNLKRKGTHPKIPGPGSLRAA